jgi:dTMP kinase
MAEGNETGARALFRAQGFRRLLIGQSVSGVGDWVATLAFIALAFELTNNQTAVAVVLVLRLVPPIFAAPVGGVLADRLDRRLIMVTCDLTRAGLILVTPFFGIGILYVIAFTHECISLLFLPARDASVPLLVPDKGDLLPLANGLVLASSFGSIPLAAAAFAGLRAVVTHIPHWVPFGHVARQHPTAFAFFFDAATFVFSAAMISRIQIPREPAGGEMHVFKGLAEAFRYVWSHSTLRSLAAGLVVSMFGGGVLFAIGIAYIHNTLHGSDVDFGWLAALWGAGMAIGLGVVRFLIRESGAPVVFMASVTLCGAVLILMGLFPQLWLAFGISVLFGACFSMAITVALSVAQRVTEDRIRGRIMASVQMLFRVGLGAGALGVGTLAQRLHQLDVGITLDGNQVGLLSGGALILLGAAASSGILRERRPLQEPTPDEANVTSRGGPPGPDRA